MKSHEILNIKIHQNTYDGVMKVSHTRQAYSSTQNFEILQNISLGKAYNIYCI
jgi:hypothetical protein